MDASRRDRPLLLVSGFGWSGSSVVTDLLLEHTRLDKPRGGEVKLLKTLGRLIERPWRDEPDAREYVRARVHPGGRYDTKVHRRRLRHTFVGLAREEFTARADALVGRLEAEGLGRRAEGEHLDDALVRDVFTEYLRLLNAAVQPADLHVVYDNLLPAYALHLLGHLDLERLPAMHLHVVDRDPRDQFHELCEHGQLAPGDVDEFVAAFRQRRQRYERARALVGERWWLRSVHHLRFEELVADDSPEAARVRQRAEDLARRTVGPGTWQLGERFRPADSRRNVGKWREAPDLGPHRAIEDALGPWCVQGPTPRPRRRRGLLRGRRRR